MLKHPALPEAYCNTWPLRTVRWFWGEIVQSGLKAACQRISCPNANLPPFFQNIADSSWHRRTKANSFVYHRIALWWARCFQKVNRFFFIIISHRQEGFSVFWLPFWHLNALKWSTKSSHATLTVPVIASVNARVLLCTKCAIISLLVSKSIFHQVWFWQKTILLSHDSSPTQH